LLKSEADVVMDMDMVVNLFKDNKYPWEEGLGQYNSDSDIGTDRDIANGTVNSECVHI